MIINTDAIVLHRMKYKNNSLIARIFTKDLGKISIIMNGAGKKKGNMFSVVEPTNIIKLTYYQRKAGTLQTCKEASFLDNNFLIRNDIIKLSVALSIVEIIDKTFRENDINTELYVLATQTLKKINDVNYDSRLILSFFLINLIRLLGFMLDLNSEYGLEINLNNEIKKFLYDLEQKPINELEKINYENINLSEIITFFENYIIHHLKLTKRIESFNMIKEIAHG